MSRYGRPVVLVVGIAVVAVLGSGVSAKEESSGAAPAQAPVGAAPAVAAPAKAAQAAATKASPQDEVRALLDGTSWALELRPEAAGKARQDTVTFKGRTVSSEWLTKSGYGSSNYSLRIEDDGLVVWETMQSKEGEGLAFWRGEIQGEQMSGLLSKQPINGQPESFSLTGRKLEAAQQAAPPPAPATTEESSAGNVRAAPTPQAQPPDAETQAPAKKKKRGLF